MLNADLQITHYLHLFVLPHNTNESFTSLKHVSGQSFTCFGFRHCCCCSITLISHKKTLLLCLWDFVVVVFLLLFTFYSTFAFIYVLLQRSTCWCSFKLQCIWPLRSTIHSLSHQPLKNMVVWENASISVVCKILRSAHLEWEIMAFSKILKSPFFTSLLIIMNFSRLVTEGSLLDS